jgi:hypothetical protein
LKKQEARIPSFGYDPDRIKGIEDVCGVGSQVVLENTYTATGQGHHVDIQFKVLIYRGSIGYKRTGWDDGENIPGYIAKGSVSINGNSIRDYEAKNECLIKALEEVFSHFNIVVQDVTDTLQQCFYDTWEQIIKTKEK